VEIRDLRLANASWGSVPEMVQIDSLSARLDVGPLLRGVLRFERLDVVKPVVVLERNTDGTGNWRVSAAAPPVPSKKRTGSPTLLDFHLHDGRVTYRTSSGALLRNDLHDLTIRAAGDDQPASLALEGAYNDTPVRLTAETQSFAVLRQGSVPFSAEFTAATPSATIDFKGTMGEPWDFDGVQGPMRIDARKLGDFLSIFGADVPADFPATLAGAFTRSGDHWKLADATGNLATSAVETTLTLAEGGRGKPDDMGITARFDRLDLDPILAGNKSGTGDYGTLSLQVDAQRGTNFDADIAAREIAYRAMRLADVATQTRLASGEITVGRLGFAFAGGRVDASGSARSATPGGRVVASAAISSADIGQIVAMLGADAGQVAGRINGRAALDMTGATVRDALRTSRGHALLVMGDGRIARALLEKLSTDLRSLFRRNATSTPISCLIAVLDLQNGLGTIAPLRLQTPGTTVIGGGLVDLPAERLDLTVKSEAASTGIFALDIPLRISGDFSRLTVLPALGSAAARLDATARNAPPQGLPPDMQQLADGNPCPR
jgi:AsmA family protein